MNERVSINTDREFRIYVICRRDKRKTSIEYCKDCEYHKGVTRNTSKKFLAPSSVALCSYDKERPIMRFFGRSRKEHFVEMRKGK